MAEGELFAGSYDPGTAPFINGVYSGVRWDSLTVSYSAPTNTNGYGSDYDRTEDPAGPIGETDVDERSAFQALNNGVQLGALAEVARQVRALTNLNLVDLGIDGGADIRAAITDSPAPYKQYQYPHGSEWTAYAFRPSGSELGGDIWFNNVDYFNPVVGTYAFHTFLHEFGHALGLKHGHEADGGYAPLPTPFDSQEFSVMTYRSYVGSGTGGYSVAAGDFPTTYMIADIAALQWMYGADYGTNSGDTTYRVSRTTGQLITDGVAFDPPAQDGAGNNTNVVFRTIWDGGGVDTYDFSAYTTALDIDLGPGRWVDLDRNGNTQAANLGTRGDGTTAWARGQIFNALLYNDNPASLIENAIGGNQADILHGNAADNHLEGRDGNDTLEGLGGDDTLDGGNGIDVADYRQATVGVNAQLGSVASGGIPGGTDHLQNIEYLWGSALRDVFYGDGGDNLLWGNAGDDVLGGLGGNDWLQGDAGDDLLQGGEGDDILEGGAGNDTLEGGGGQNTFLGGDGDDVLRSGAASEELNGGDGFDTADYSLSPTRIMVDLRIGTGKLYAGDAFGDVLVSIEAIRGSGFDDVMNGSDTAGDVAYGGSGHDSLSGFGGDDTLAGEDGNDTLDGGAGNDLLVGGNGDDMLITGGGNDTVYGDDGFDVVGFQGNGLLIDLASGGGGTLLVSVEGVQGTVGNDTILGTAVDNYLLGGDGDDSLAGGAGQDTLEGGAGWDTMDGGPGADLVSYRGRNSAVKVDLGFDRGDGTFGKISGADSGDTFVSIEDLEGTDYNDTLLGDGGFNVLYGGDGDDELHGIGGGDALHGGKGDDAFITAGNDYAYGEEGQDHVVFAAGAVGLNLGNQSLNSGAAQFGRFFGIETFYGTTGNDSMVAGAEGVAFYGLAGADQLTGGAGDDTLGGSEGADLLDGGGGFDMAEYIGDGVGVLVDLRAGVFAHGEAQGDAAFGMSGIGGGGGNDSLGGTEAANRLLGRGGNDYMSGYGGADTLEGGDGDDSMEGGTGADLLDGGAGNDRLGDNEQVVLLFATDDASADTLLGGAGNDTLLALSGNDSLDGGSGLDSMAGGAGDDTYGVDAAGDLVSEAANQGTDTVLTWVNYTLPANVERLVAQGSAGLALTGNNLANEIIGAGGNDTLNGGGANDTLSGGAGNDSLIGGAGADSMAGGSGDDTYAVADATDIVAEAADEGIDTVRSGIAWTLGANLENLVFLNGAAGSGIGNALANGITGNAGADSLSGLDGNDTLNGLGGNDSLAGGNNDDALDGGTGADSMAGGAGNDSYWVDDIGDVVTEATNSGTDTVYTRINYTLGGTLENLTSTIGGLSLVGNALANVLTGSAGGETLNGGGRNDTIDAGGGNDSIIGGVGADSMLGGAGNDTYVVDDLGDVVVELAGEGLDTVRASIAYTLGAEVENLVLTAAGGLAGTGNALANSITGGNGHDSLSGLEGNDTLSGGAGNDTLLGGAGADRLTGGTGADRFRFTAEADAGDIIVDFTSGTDRIEVTGFVGIGAGPLGAGQFASNLTGMASGGVAMLVYETDAGRLWWDADGQAGGALLLATLVGKPALLATDIWGV